MTNLENVIKINAQNYYENGQQVLSDDVFDAVVDKVREENPQSEVVNQIGWGYEVNTNGKVKHKYGQVGSLMKVRTYEEVKNKLMIGGTLHDIDVSAKLDGLSVVLYYKLGALQQAVTRGDGTYGVDITDKVKYIMGTSDIDDHTFTGAVRGELVMSVDDFARYKELHPEAKNPRNSAIGIINSKEVAKNDLYWLSVVVYSVIGIETSDGHEARLSISDDIKYWLDENFYYTAPRVYYHSMSAGLLDSSLKSLHREWSQKWPIDGVVISKDELQHNVFTNEIKQTAVAWKFQEEIKITTVKHIEWTMSKNSCYIPVVVFEPIELAGTTVQRATAFNAKFVKDNDICEGTVIAVAKRGEIIPQIMEVIKQ